MEIKKIQMLLFEKQDLKYRDFQAKLMPTIHPDTIIGVRTPDVRLLAKALKNEDLEEFLNTLPHEYYEENNLHAFLIEGLKDYEKAIMHTETFLPHIDNWATCDSFCPKVFKTNLPLLLERIQNWLKSKRTYTVRFGIGMLMRFYLGEEFKDEYANLVCNVSSGEYYINMMRAWYFATALSKQYEKILPYIEEKRLDTFTHNKTIQKAIESYRITDEQKKYLRTLKI